ncbi:electron transporter RnfC [Pseudodesulfovibrio sediminis]|uniref:Electron transport complex protein RnfC n=1 Tax=Pseudodesulfovibrio sediminis TaxID=2810563 RepID=A0ABM8I346_9BACT|nr:electron transporter RnfC [Pseudodesulfovibrio sediminis]BCS87428.1 electron transport complex protein RnfC [Pseudodesulfovibrio sediminis]
MTISNFSLHTGETGPLIQASTPDRLRVPIYGMTPILAEGDQVLAGTRIALSNNEDRGDMHAPLAGTIKAVYHDYMHIEVTGEERTEPLVPCSESGNALRKWLRDMGINVARLNRTRTLIINGVPPEPGISIYEPLLRDYRKVLEIGLDTIQRIVEPIRIFMVVAEGNQTNAFANCTVKHVAPIYPKGLDPLVIKTVTGQEVLPGMLPKNGTILSVKELYFIGRVMESGRPVSETVMTLGTQNHLVRIGTPVGWLTKELGVKVQPGDRLVLGGAMRGMTAVNLEQGVDKQTNGLTLFRKEEGLETTDNFCLGCGECERHCPSRLMPGMISRCAEFKQFKRAERFHIHSCIECGLCGYWCTAQRPLLQYIRLAKYELALLAGAELPPDVPINERDKKGDAPC